MHKKQKIRNFEKSIDKFGGGGYNILGLFFAKRVLPKNGFANEHILGNNGYFWNKIQKMYSKKYHFHKNDEKSKIQTTKK